MLSAKHQQLGPLQHLDGAGGGPQVLDAFSGDALHAIFSCVGSNGSQGLSGLFFYELREEIGPSLRLAISCYSLVDGWALGLCSRCSQRNKKQPCNPRNPCQKVSQEFFSENIDCNAIAESRSVH